MIKYPPVFLEGGFLLCYNNVIIMKKIQIITLFPEMFEGVFNSSMLWKAQKNKAVEFEVIDLRQFGLGARNQTDDPPYGGGDGMLMMVEPAVRAIEHAKKNDPSARVMIPTPRGKVYKQSDAKRLAADEQGVIMFCPRYEGYDERITNWVDEQFCIGNYVLTGGEIPAMVMADSITRLLPGVLGGEKSAEIESFQADDEYVEFPQYTRPEEFQGLNVPDVLLSGHHAEIEKWRKTQSKKS